MSCLLHFLKYLNLFLSTVTYVISIENGGHFLKEKKKATQKS